MLYPERKKHTRSRAARPPLVLAAALLLSCSTPTGMCACPPARTHAVVHGVVSTASGAPVEGAAVSYILYRQRCGRGFAEPGSHGAPPVRTGADGRYETHVYSTRAWAAPCLRVEASRGTDGSGGADAVAAEVPAVEMRPEHEPPATVRVDLVFP